jgi:pimeloyl-ACP methyl ester carboxylesterase
MPSAFVEMIWEHWDGTQAAVLALYRHANPGDLARAGSDLATLSCPSLIVWGDRDPYLPTRFAEAYAHTLPAATLEVVPTVGHWPWIDDARVVDRVLDFLG